jgi:hypothetical protein
MFIPNSSDNFNAKNKIRFSTGIKIITVYWKDQDWPYSGILSKI